MPASSKSKRILINSLPKSGTHLLAQAIGLLGYREHFAEGGNEDATQPMPRFFNNREVRKALANSGESPVPGGRDTITVGSLTPCPVSLPTFRRWLAAVPPGYCILGHILWTQTLHPLLAELDYRHVFIIRDPRAVVVSLIAFILDTGKMPGPHLLEADLKAMTPAQRLDFVLTGGYASKADIHTLPFAELYRSMLNWRDAPDCLFLRYEDLVGELGGGSATAQRIVVERLAEHLDVSLDDSMAARIYNPHARTFRTGQINAWRQALDAAGLARLEAACAPLCEAAGYEGAA